MEKFLEETIKTGFQMKALSQASVQRINVDTTVQEKAVTFPTNTKLCYRMLMKLVKVAKAGGLELRQSYTRSAKRSLIMQDRYAHARQMNRAKKQIKKLRTHLGRITRDIGRKILGRKELEASFAPMLEMAKRLFSQKRDDKNKLYSLHAPEVECIAKGKAHKKTCKHLPI